MKLSVIAADLQGWHVKDLAVSSKRAGINFQVHLFKKDEDINHVAQVLGDVILWRSSALPAKARHELLHLLVRSICT